MSYSQLPPRIDFGWIGRGWAMFTARPGAWIGALAIYLMVTIIICVAVAVPTGAWDYFRVLFQQAQAGQAAGAAPAIDPRTEILRLLPFSLVLGCVNGVLYGGLYRMGLRQIRGESITAGGVFSAMDAALPLIAIALMFAIINDAISLAVPQAGGILGVILQGLFFFAPLIVVDKRVGPIDALIGSLEMLKGQRWMGILFYFVLLIVSALGAIACGIGIVATLPLLFLTLAVGYSSLTDPQVPSSPDYGQPQPGTWPPPPSPPV